MKELWRATGRPTAAVGLSAWHQQRAALVMRATVLKLCRTQRIANLEVLQCRGTVSVNLSLTREQPGAPVILIDTDRQALFRQKIAEKRGGMGWQETLGIFQAFFEAHF